MSQREYDPNDSIDFIYRTGPEFAKARAERVYLEEWRKSKKALLMKQYQAINPKESIAAQEREAYADLEYREVLEGIRAATEKEEAYRWQLVAAQARIEVYRTESANNRRMDRAAT